MGFPRAAVAAFLLLLVPSASGQLQVACVDSHTTPGPDGNHTWTMTARPVPWAEWGEPLQTRLVVGARGLAPGGVEPVEAVATPPPVPYEQNQSAWDDARWSYTVRFPDPQGAQRTQEVSVQLQAIVDGTARPVADWLASVLVGPPRLHPGEAVRACHAAEMDLDGDGSPDLWFTDALGGPAPQEHTVYASDVDGQATGRVLWMTTTLLDRWQPATLRIRQDAAAALLGGNASAIEAHGSASTAVLGPADGNFTWRVGPWVEMENTYSLSSRAESSLQDLRRRPVPSDPEGLEGWGWRDGEDLYLNVTHWDLDGDDEDDLRFWESGAADATAAGASSADERRQAPVQLVLHAVVRDTLDERQLRLLVHRFDGSSAGAWVELRNADDLFRRLLATPAVEANATPEYEVDLGPDAGLVLRDGSTVWAWFGHFSERELTIALPLRQPDGTPPPTSGPAGRDGPLATAPLAGAALLALAVLCRRRR